MQRQDVEQTVISECEKILYLQGWKDISVQSIPGLASSQNSGSITNKSRRRKQQMREISTNIENPARKRTPGDFCGGIGLICQF